jgi:hypothetical protein
MKTFLCIIVLFFSVSSFSNERNIYDLEVNKNPDWQIFAAYENDDGSMIAKVYNIKTIRNIGDIKGIEEITFYQKEESLSSNEKFKYITTYLEIDCNQYKVKPIGLATFYSKDRVFVGEVDNEDNHEWTKFAIGTPYDSLHKLVC